MKNITNYIFLLLLQFIFCYNLDTNDFKSFINESPFLKDKIKTNHRFSIISNSLNGSISSYGVYGNHTSFSLNNRTQIYTDVNLIQNMSSTFNTSDNLDYSIKFGMNYKISDKALLIIELNRIKSSNISQFNSSNNFFN